MIEKALRLNVKWSMQEIARAINGDGKSIPNPLFKVMVLLNSQVSQTTGYIQYMYLHLQYTHSFTMHFTYMYIHMYTCFRFV